MAENDGSSTPIVEQVGAKPDPWDPRSIVEQANYEADLAVARIAREVSR